MAVEHGIKKFYSSFRGLNEILDDVTRDAGFATEATNVRLLEDGSLSKRRGYKIFADDAGGYGVIAFDRIDPELGTITKEILILSGTLHRMRTAELTITNNNSNGQGVTISVAGDSTSGTSSTGWGSAPWGAFGWGDPAGRGFQVLLDVAAVIDNNGDTTFAAEEVVFYLGDEIENPGLTIASLVTALNSSAHLTASASVETSTPAPFLELLNGETLAPGESLTLTYYYTEEVTKDSGAGLPLGFAAFKTDDDAIFVDTAIFNRSLYVANGLDDLQQYDGQAFFKAGVKPGTLPTTATGGAGNPNGTYFHKVQPIFRDRNGLEHVGAISDSSASLSPSSQEIDMTITNVEDAEGYDARGGLASGAQTLSPVGGSVTITLDDGSGGAHTVAAGDKVRIFNRDVATADYAEYVVTATTTTTIVVTSSVDIDLNDNDIVSTGIFLDVFRTVAGGTTFFLVERLNNNPFATTQAFTDDLADASLGARFLEPLRIPGIPAKTRHVTTFNNSLVLGNSPTDPNKVYYSEPDAPTNFPVLNDFLTESNDGGFITALTQSNETLIIFRQRSIFTMTGDFSRDRINVNNLSSGGIGCKSHTSIQDINGVLFFLGDRGVYAMAGASLPQLVSDQVIKTLTTKRTLAAEALKLSRATAVHHVQDKQYILFIPAESTDAGNIHSTDFSLTLVYDYVKDNWTTWENVPFSSGVTYSGDTLWFSSRELRTADTAVSYRVWKQHNDNQLHDYGDQLDGIRFFYGSGWESLGRPSIAKKFLRLKLHSFTDLDIPIPISAFTVDATTEIDYKEHSPHSVIPTFTFPDRGSTWDSRPWDTFTWGGAQQPTFKTKLRKGQARSLRLTLENSQYDTNVIFTGWEVEYAAPQSNTIKQ